MKLKCKNLTTSQRDLTKICWMRRKGKRRTGPRISKGTKIWEIRQRSYIGMDHQNPRLHLRSLTETIRSPYWGWRGLFSLCSKPVLISGSCVCFHRKSDLNYTPIKACENYHLYAQVEFVMGIKHTEHQYTLRPTRPACHDSAELVFWKLWWMFAVSPVLF